MLVNYHSGIANIAQGLDQCLYMGTLDALRDWGLAKDYVEMQWLMLQQDKPEDFVIATGVQFSVRNFIDKTAKELGITLAWEGEGIKEQGRVAKIEPPATSARRKWRPCWVIRRRLKRSLAGCRRSPWTK